MTSWCQGRWGGDAAGQVFRSKLTSSEEQIPSIPELEINLKLSNTCLETTLDTSPFSTTSFDSAIGDVYSSVDMHRSDVEVGDGGRGGSSSHAKIIIESLLSDAPYDRKA